MMGLVILLALAWVRNHYINQGIAICQAQVAQAVAVENARMADVNTRAAKDAADKALILLRTNNALEVRIAHSEAQNETETDTPCLSDARRLRINSIRRQPDKADKTN